MADQDDTNHQHDAGQPGFDPKPVQLGGESIVDRLLPYRKKILIGVLLGFAVWGVIAIVFYVRNRGRERNTARISRVVDVTARQVRSAEATPDPKDKEPTYASNKERAQAALDASAKEGATLAPLHRAGLLVQAGKLDEAITAYRALTADRGHDGVIAREGLGIALETRALAAGDAAARQRGLEEALTEFEAMQPDDKGPRRAYALYHQGRILSQLGKAAEAKAAFEKAKAQDAGGELATLIDERLASLGAS